MQSEQNETAITSQVAVEGKKKKRQHFKIETKGGKAEDGLKDKRDDWPFCYALLLCPFRLVNDFVVMQ